MKNEIISNIIFTQYIIEKMVFEINNEFQPNEPTPLDIKFDNHISVNIADHKAIINLGCTIFEDFKEKNYPFFMLAKIKAFFDFESSLTDEEVKKLLEINGTAIVFPYLRMIISNLTVNSGLPPLILPTVNISKMLEHISKE